METCWEETDSPRGVLEMTPESAKGSNISRCSSTTTFTGDRPPTRKGKMEAFRMNSVKRLSAIPLFSSSSHMISRKSLRKLTRMRSAEETHEHDSTKLKSFEYSDIVVATDDFCLENLVGKGGNAEVYRGRLHDGRIVAVKKLVSKEKNDAEQMGDFLTEIGIIGQIKHPNSCEVIGFGSENGYFFVLHYAVHGSLDSHLFGSEKLEWNVRFKVAIGIAKGLRYLHHECPRRIIHRDIKASNILIDENYEPLISDYGLAKWLPQKWGQHIVSPIEGTVGYLAPEYFMHGIVDEKTDVFAYGVLLLEIITGRRAVDSNSRQSLVIWAKPILSDKNVKELADPRLEDNYDPTEMDRAMVTASKCIHHTASFRPYMNQVVHMLMGEEGPIEVKSQNSMPPRSQILDDCEIEDSTSLSNLNDLKRHMELIME